MTRISDIGDENYLICSLLNKFVRPEYQEIIDLQDLIKKLNSIKNGIVVVEGKRDEHALRKIGYSGKIFQFHSFKGLVKFVDKMPTNRKLVLLLDSDRKGRYLTKRIISILQHRMNVDLIFRRKITLITKGKIKNIEDLSHYVENDDWITNKHLYLPAKNLD
jgi:5S rRNA maturation endonuclease (ribonuclease M5)